MLDLPEPQAGPGEVRVRVHAAAVSPTDIMLRTGGHAVRMPGRRPPFVPGMDAAGVIDQLGPGADGRLEVGQRVVVLVLFTGPHGGAYAEQVVVPATSAGPVGQPLSNFLEIRQQRVREAVSLPWRAPEKQVRFDEFELHHHRLTGNANQVDAGRVHGCR